MLCRPTLVLGLIGATLFSPLPAADRSATDARMQFLEDVRATDGFARGRPRSPTLLWDGNTVLYLRSGPRDAALHLYSFDVATGRETELLSPAMLQPPPEERPNTGPSFTDRVRRERLRDTAEGITSYELIDDDAGLLLAPEGRLCVFHRVDGTLDWLPGHGWINPELSPDQHYIAAVRDGELHVIDRTTRNVTQLTHGASATVSHGLPEFAALEEMERYAGFWWSPDGARLLYQETDESAVELHYIADPAHPEIPPEPQRYPRTGTPAARVRLWLVPRDGGTAVRVRWDEERYPYLARVRWWNVNAPLTLIVQNRTQTEQVLLTVNPRDGDTRRLLRERDPAWLNLDAYNTMPHWLPDGRHFFWTTERRGAWQVELRRRSGGLVRALTPLNWSYAGLLGLEPDGQSILVRGTSDTREMHLWRFPLSGEPGAPVTSGQGVHQWGGRARDRRRLHFVDTPDGRASITVEDASGAVVATLPSEAETPARPLCLELTRTPGEPAFDAAIVRPSDFVPGTRYPVLLEVYAGPDHKVVTAAGRNYFDAQALAEFGFIVVSIDGRGTPLRGRAWERVIKGNLIDVALDDQVAGLQALATRYPEMDLTRVGIWGWSFGGYVSAMATIRRPDVFRCGIAIAPVVTWESYDAHYTERFLGLPEDAPEAYRRSNLTTYASQLERPLLLAHGMRDDNVHFQHSLQLVQEFFRTGRSFEFVPLDGTHLVSDTAARHQLDRRILAFFQRHLGAEPARTSGFDPERAAGRDFASREDERARTFSP